jgi:hypothetical protein
MNAFRSLSNRSWSIAIVIAVILGAIAYYVTRPTDSGGNNAGPVAGDGIQRNEIGTVLSPDAIRAIDNPSFTSGSGVLAATRVIAVDLGGESHAFPIATLSEHEIVNDRLAGKNIAITW